MCSINRVMLTCCWFLCLESVCHLCFLVLLYEPPCVCIIDVSVCWYLWTYLCICVCICVCCQHSADNEPQRTAGKSKRSASSLEPKLTKKRKMDTAPNPLDATWIHPESYDLADKWVHCICELVLGVVLGRGSTRSCPHCVYVNWCWVLSLVEGRPVHVLIVYMWTGAGCCPWSRVGPFMSSLCICELVLGVVLGRGSTRPCPHMSVCWRLLWVYHVDHNMQ